MFKFIEFILYSNYKIVKAWRFRKKNNHYHNDEGEKDVKETARLFTALFISFCTMNILVIIFKTQIVYLFGTDFNEKKNLFRTLMVAFTFISIGLLYQTLLKQEKINEVINKYNSVKYNKWLYIVTLILMIILSIVTTILTL
jgi:hypothetical protein